MNERSVDMRVRVKGKLESVSVELFGFTGGPRFGAGLEEERESVGIGVKARVEHASIQV